MSEQTIDRETGEIHDGDEPADAQEEAAREAEQEAEIAAKPKREASSEQLKKAGQATANYHKRIAEILGPDDQRHECPTCEGKGIVWGEPEVPDDLVHPDNYVMCLGCNGYGAVVSGSKDPNYATVVCTDCQGKGYQITAAQPAFVPQVVPNAPPAAQTLQGQYVPGRGFIPYGSDEPLPGTLGA